MEEDDLYDPETPDSKAWKIDAPTPEEIRQRCAEIRATWDEETRLSRIADHTMHPDYVCRWEVPVVSIRDIDTEMEGSLGGVIDDGAEQVAEYEGTWHPVRPYDKTNRDRSNIL